MCISCIYQIDHKMKIADALINMQSDIKKKNKATDIKTMSRYSPYQIKNSMKIKPSSTTTYQEMFKNSKDKEILTQLKDFGFNKGKDTIFLFDGAIEPEQVYWKFGRHPEEIGIFLRILESDMKTFERKKDKWQQTGSEAIDSYKKLKKIQKWNQSSIQELADFLNLALNHSMLKKSSNILTFVNHCVPIDLWNLNIFQQTYISKQEQQIGKKPISIGKNLDYITVTGDGIIRSTKNLLQSRIEKMLPYTNQFRFGLQLYKNGNLILKIISFENQSFEANFKTNYIKALNIYLGIKKAISNSQLFNTTQNRFKSFSKQRQNCWARLYNDGQGYFEDMCNALDQARSQVLITDWWMTPYFLLKRPGTIKDKVWRLDGVLKRIADRGVRVFIILFREPFNMLCNDSVQAQLYLESLSRNIKVRRHPIIPQLWSHHQKSCIIDQIHGFMGGLDLCYGRWDTPHHWITNKDDMWNGGDYSNERLRAFPPGTTNQYTQSPVDRTKQPRMPWHDIGIRIYGDAVIDLIRHFIQYWNYVSVEKNHDCAQYKRGIGKRYDRAFKYQDVKDGWEQQDAQKQKTCGDKIKDTGKGIKAFVVGSQRRLPQLLIEVREGYKFGNLQLQLCRSASEWSIGATKTQESIHLAYQQLVEESENFIYIQNQFFMGKKNKIVDSLARRIRRAYNKKQNFKVVVVMPLLPGFDGDIENPSSVSLRVQAQNQYDAINRSQNSLYSRFNDLPGFDIKKYIYFFGLRGHALLNDKPITEIIYIHSKLMIVDDKRAIIGSANINDRSLLGTRDSELAIVIEQNNGKIQGQKFQASIYELRCRLFNEHFDFSPKETQDINKPQIWEKLIETAKNNTLLYREVFGCYPDDTITVGAEVKLLAEKSKPDRYSELKKKLVGHYVEFPLEFMKDEDMSAKFGDKEGLLGEQLFL